MAFGRGRALRWDPELRDLDLIDVRGEELRDLIVARDGERPGTPIRDELPERLRTDDLPERPKTRCRIDGEPEDRRRTTLRLEGPLERGGRMTLRPPESLRTVGRRITVPRPESPPEVEVGGRMTRRLP